MSLSTEAMVKHFCLGFARGRGAGPRRDARADCRFGLRHQGVQRRVEDEAVVVIVAKKDQAIAPDEERFFAKRMKATTTELDTSHVPMLSKPKDVAAVIIDAAAKAPTKHLGSFGSADRTIWKPVPTRSSACRG